MSQIFHRTMLALERALTCELIASDFDLESGVFALDVPSEEIVTFAAAEERGFLGVPLASVADGEQRHITHVAFVDLAERAEYERRPLGVSDVISSGTSIGVVIELLSRQRYYFVMEGPDVRKIVTVSDLNKLPVRTWLFTLLAHLEGLLANMIGYLPGDEKWLLLLTEKRRREVQELHETKRRDDFDTRLIDCTTITDKMTIIARTPALRVRFNQQSRKEFDHYLRPIRELRNRIGHGILPISDPALLDEALGPALQETRDHLWHGQAISKPRDPKWLALVNGRLLQLIELAALSGRGA